MLILKITFLLLLNAEHIITGKLSKNNNSPSIYNFIANNAYICSPVQLPDGSSVVFLSEEAGESCTKCDHASLGYGNACGTIKATNKTDQISCFEVPPLCMEAFELRYAAHLKVVKNQVTPKKSRKRLKRVHNKRFLFIGTTTTTTAPKTTPPPCEDKHSLCCFWATTGECDKNPFWMRLHCAKTCGTCKCSCRWCFETHFQLFFQVGNADRCKSDGINCTLPTTTEATTTTSTTPRTTTIPTTTLAISSSTKKKYTRPYTPPANGFRRTQTPTTKESDKTLPTTTPTTTTEKTTTTELLTTPDMKCRDYHDECPFWAMLGECRLNPFYMRPQCQKACNSCGENVDSVYAPTPRPGCDNGHRLCNYWAHIGECSSNANYMLPNCRLACRVC